MCTCRWGLQTMMLVGHRALVSPAPHSRFSWRRGYWVGGWVGPHPPWLPHCAWTGRRYIPTHHHSFIHSLSYEKKKEEDVWESHCRTVPWELGPGGLSQTSFIAGASSLRKTLPFLSGWLHGALLPGIYCRGPERLQDKILDSYRPTPHSHHCHMVICISISLQ